MTKAVYSILAAALAGTLSVSAYAQVAVPELREGAVALPEGAQAEQAPPVAVDAGVERTLSITFSAREKAEEALGKLAGHLATRLKEAVLVDRGSQGVEMNVRYTGSPVTVWVSVYKKEDQRRGLYYLGPRLDDEQVKQYQERGQQALAQAVGYLESEGKGIFFPKPKVHVIWSYTTIGRVNGHSDRGQAIEVLSPFSYLFVDGAIPDGCVRHLNKDRFMPVALSK